MAWPPERVVNRDLSRVEPASASRRFDRLLGNVVSDAALEDLAILGDEEVGLLSGKEIVIVFSEQVRPRQTQEVLSCLVEVLEPELLRLFHEDHRRDVLDDFRKKLA